MSGSDTQHPCRVFGVSAPAAPRVALLRRGPSRWVQLLLWRTDDDTIEHGQWLRGRVYERRCSLSPDGLLFAYFVSKITRRTLHDKDYTYAWTAVSRPPYFTALALWPKGDCWNGGGVFQDNRTLLLNHDVARAHRRHTTNWLRVISGARIPWFHEWGENEPIYGAILEQQGWRCTQEGRCDDAREQLLTQLRSPAGSRKLQVLYTQAEIWQKPHLSGGFVLRQNMYGVDYNQYGSQAVMDRELEETATHQVRRIERAEWADWDARGRLIFTRDGQVWAVQPGASLDEAALIADLNDQRPTRVQSPAWARQWPQARARSGGE